MTVLLEYLDLILDARSWVSLYNKFESDSSVLLQGLSMMTIPTTERFPGHHYKRLASCTHNLIDFISKT